MKSRSQRKQKTAAGQDAPQRPQERSKERWRKSKAGAGQKTEVRAGDKAAGKTASKAVLKTLDRVISKAGVASRTLAGRWIAQGRVKVNGVTVKDAEHWVDLKKDKVLLDGKPLEPKEKIYLLLYKPKGYLTTRTDPDGRPTIYDLLEGMREWVFPVGRLDQDTSGLLILTNDSALAEHLTNPDYHVPKTYMVKTAHVLSEEQLDALRQGIELKDGPTRPAEVTRLRDSGQRSFLEITITEGRNRQVRRMVEEMGSKVLKLVRVQIGPLRIGGLEIGHVRALEAGELKALRHAGGQRRQAEASNSNMTPAAGMMGNSLSKRG